MDFISNVDAVVLELHTLLCWSSYLKVEIMIKIIKYIYAEANDIYNYLALRSANVSLSCSNFPFLNLIPDLLASMML